MAEHPPPAASMAAPMSPKRAQTVGNTPVPTGPVAQSSPMRALFNAVATGAASAAASFLSPPPRDINTAEPGSEPSAITTVTKATPAAAAAAAKRPVELDSDDESSAAPKKPKYADFNTKKSDDNSLMSAEDEAGWEKESDEMMQMAEVARNNEEVAAENMGDSAVENNVAFGYEEGEVNVGGVPTPQTERTFTWKRYNYSDRKVTDGVLKQVLRKLSLPTSGSKKRHRFDRIRDSGKDDVKKIDDDTFEVKHYDEEEKDLPKWIILSGTPVPSVPGIDMEVGATEGFHNPTNPDKIPIAANRKNFLTGEGERIKRPTFAKKPTKKDPTPTEPPPIVGGPSKKAEETLPSVYEATPHDYFNTQITDKFIQAHMVNTSNARAVAEGEGVNTGFVPFDKAEMKVFIGFLMANGITPRPQLEHWFDDCWLLGNPTMKNKLQKKNRDGTTIPAKDRLRQIRRLMCLYDHRDNAREETKKDPLFKVRPLLDELNRQAKKMWLPGKFVSVDEQTIGFKGKHGLKLRISYKREGDGFQCDAICDRGYTFSFWFRHGEAPNVGHSNLDLSPTARRVVWLARQLPNNWSCVFMDNLFNSRKLFTALYAEMTLAHGVSRTNGRGIPEAIIIPKEKNKEKANSIRGTTKAARLINSPDCPDLLAIAVMDTQPVHFLSTVAETVEWDVMTRERVWSITDRELQTMKFLRLNFIDLYNNFMNSVDIADQLRNNYRPDQWMRQRKWWWAYFIWAIGVATTNGWLIYESRYDKELKRIQKRKMKNDLPKKLTHLEFIIELINELMFPEEYEKEKERLREAMKKGDASTVSSKSTRSGKSFSSSSVDLSSVESVNKFLKESRPDSITDKKLDSDHFSSRFDGFMHTCLPIFKDGHRCQYCYYKWRKMNQVEQEQKENKKMERNGTMLRRCVKCNVNLCWTCELEWHGVHGDSS